MGIRTWWAGLAAVSCMGLRCRIPRPESGMCGHWRAPGPMCANLRGTGAPSWTCPPRPGRAPDGMTRSSMGTYFEFAHCLANAHAGVLRHRWSALTSLRLVRGSWPHGCGSPRQGEFGLGLGDRRHRQDPRGAPATAAGKRCGTGAKATRACIFACAPGGVGSECACAPGWRYATQGWESAFAPAPAPRGPRPGGALGWRLRAAPPARMASAASAS